MSKEFARPALVPRTLDAPVTPPVECRPTGSPTKARSGIGMPTSLYLQDFGELLRQVFGEAAYHVGSSLTEATWRDVDVRVMLDAEQYAAMGFGDPDRPHESARWCAYAMAFSELGRRLTGLPIDFQVQETATANRQFPDYQRSALIGSWIRRGNQKLSQRGAGDRAGTTLGSSAC